MHIINRWVSYFGSRLILFSLLLAFAVSLCGTQIPTVFEYLSGAAVSADSFALSLLVILIGIICIFMVILPRFFAYAKGDPNVHLNGINNSRQLKRFITLDKGLLAVLGIAVVFAALIALVGGGLAVALYLLLKNGQGIGDIRSYIDLASTLLCVFSIPVLINLIFSQGFGMHPKWHVRGIGRTVLDSLRSLKKRYFYIIYLTLVAYLAGFFGDMLLSMIKSGLLHAIVSVITFTIAGGAMLLILTIMYRGKFMIDDGEGYKSRRCDIEARGQQYNHMQNHSRAVQGGDSSNVLAVRVSKFAIEAKESMEYMETAIESILLRFYRRSRRPLAAILTIALLAAYMPNVAAMTVFADEINTDFSQSGEANTYTPEDAEPSVIMHEPIHAKSDIEEELPGREVAHDSGSRTFELPDGSYTKRIYDQPISYINEKGKEVEIDNTLKKVGESFSNKAGTYTATLPNEGDGITLQKDGHTLTLVPLSYELKNAVAKDNAIRYNGAAEGIDVQFTAQSTYVKEEIILNHPVETSIYSYELTGEGFRYELSDNALNVYSKDAGRAKEQGSSAVSTESADADDPIFTIAAPLMTDGGGEVSPPNMIELSFTEEGGKHVLTIEADREWLSAKERIYPVIIDPTVLLDPSNLEWTLVTNGTSRQGYSGDGDSYHSNNQYLYVGFENGSLVGNGIMYGQTRTYLKFNYDFSANLPEDVIFHAYLSLYKYAGAVNPPRNVYANIVLSDWQSSRKTWNTQPTEHSMIGEGADVSGEDKWVSWDISEALIEWMHGTPNRGIVLTTIPENNPAVCFAGPGNPHGGNAPMFLDINWTVPNPVPEDLPTGPPEIHLRPLTKTHSTGLQTFNSLFADGIVRPQLDVYYSLQKKDDPAEIEPGIFEKADYGRRYPNSDKFSDPASPLFFDQPLVYTRGWYMLYEGNWQTHPFLRNLFSPNTVYNIHAQGANEDFSLETDPGKSDDFIIYKFTAQDTLPYVASFYGVTVEQLVKDNRPQDYLAFPGNTFFIRNPKKNANVPYTRPDNLTVDHMRDLIYANNGRGMLSEFDLEPINMNTGNFYMENADAESSEYTDSFKLTRSYNAIGPKQTGAFGIGFSFDYLRTLTGAEDGSIRYTMGDGKQIVFTKDGAGYKAPAGYDLNLARTAPAPFVNAAGETEYHPEEVRFDITDSSGEKATFDCYGLLRSITNDRGAVTAIGYDADYHINSITTPAGRVYSLTTNAEGQITAVTLPNGGILRYEYMDGYLTAFTNADGDKLTYSYDSNGLMSEWYDGKGDRQVKNEYDGQGRVVKQTNASGAVAELTYDDGKTTIIEEGQIKVYEYDSAYRTTKIEDAGGTIKRTYNGENRLYSETDKSGNTTGYEYDSKGNITKKTRADGAFESMSYNATGKPLTVRDANGNVTVNEYNSAGDLVKVTNPDGSEICYARDAYGRPTSITSGGGGVTSFSYPSLKHTIMTDPNGQVTNLYYDNMGRLINEVDALGIEHRTTYTAAGKKAGTYMTGGVSFSYEYDSAGDCIAIIDAVGSRSTYEYNGLYKITKAEDPAGGTITSAYDRLGYKVSDEDSYGNVTLYENDFAGRIIKETDPASGVSLTEYDANGNVIKETSPNGGVTSYEYDAVLGLKTKVANSLGTTLYEYDILGNLTKEINPDGSSSYHSYDAMSRVIETKDTSGLVTKYEYDLDGNMVRSTDNAGRVDAFVYDKAGNLLSSTDAEGRMTSYEYDAADRLIKKTEPGNLVTSYTLDTAGNITGTENPDGVIESYEYDGAGNVTAKIDADGNRTEYSYTALGDIEAKVDALGNTVTYSYTKSQQLERVVGALYETTIYEYGKAGRLSKVTDPVGAVTRMEYDKEGHVTLLTKADGSFIKTDYDKEGNILRTEDSLGLVRKYEYDESSRLTHEVSNAGSDNAYIYDKAGRLTKQTDALGRTATFTYDLMGNLLKQVDLNGDVSTYTYDLLGRVTSYAENDGRKTVFTYDEAGNLIEEKDASGQSNKYEYDKLGRLLKEIDPIGRITGHEYSRTGNPAVDINPDGTKKSYEYDEVGRQTGIITENGNKSAYSYDASGNIIKKTEANGAVYEFSYDFSGNAVKSKDPYGYVTEYSYDKMGRLLDVISPRGGVTKYAYDSHGNVIKETDAEGAITDYVYSLNDELREKRLPNGLLLTYEYDKAGRILMTSDSEGLSHTLTYDRRGDIVNETDSLGATVSYAYDNMHRITANTNPMGAMTSLSYDKDGNLTSEISETGAANAYSFDKVGRLISVKLPDSYEVSYSYDKMDRVEAIVQGERTYAYSYDKEGNAVKETNPMGDSIRRTYSSLNLPIEETDYMGGLETFSYDLLGRMTEETDALGSSVSYAYDAQSNLSSVTDAAGFVNNFEYDKMGRLTKVIDPLRREAVYSYDDMGNISEKSEAGRKTSYSYDKHDNLVRITSPAGKVEQFIYDVKSRLKEKTLQGGNRIKYDYDKIDGLLKKSYSTREQDVTYGYDESGRKLTMNDGTGSSRYVYDELDRLISFTDGRGGKLTYSYNPYGEMESIGYPDGRKVSYTYDLQGRLIKVSDSKSGDTDYTYDKNGDVLSASRAGNINTMYAYDKVGRLTSLVNEKGGKPLSSFSYTYSLSGQIAEETAVQDAHTSVKTFTYDEAGQLKGYTEDFDGKVTNTSYTYNTFGERVETVRDGKSAYRIRSMYNEDGQLLYEKDERTGRMATFRYDANGNLIEKPVAGGKRAYTYDIENRLKAVREGGSLLMAASYDGDGNRTFQLSRMLVPYTAYESEVPDEGFLSEDAVPEVNTYLSEGESWVSMFWFGFWNQGLKQVVGSNPALIESVSDWFVPAWSEHVGDVQRVDTHISSDDIDAMKDEGLTDKDITGAGILIPTLSSGKIRTDYELTYYVNDINREHVQVAAEMSSTGRVKNVYTYGNERISKSSLPVRQTSGGSNKQSGSRGNISTYLYDGRGSVAQEVAGKTEKNYFYDPYGQLDKTLSDVGVNDVFFGYNAEEYSSVTGLQYLRARYYMPEKATFITEDTVLGEIQNINSQNRYTYAENDPVNKIDPSGHYATSYEAQMASGGSLNEMRNTLVGNQLQIYQNAANANFYGTLNAARGADATNINAVNGISYVSQAQANYYINQGKNAAYKVCQNFACTPGAITNAAVNNFASNVNASKNSVNSQIQTVKANKQAEYNAYQERKEAEEKAARAREAAARAQLIKRWMDTVIANAPGKGKKSIENLSNQIAKEMAKPNGGDQKRLASLFDSMASYLIDLAPGVNVNGGKQMFPVNGGYAYLNATSTFGSNIPGGTLNLTLADQRQFFKSFTTSTGTSPLNFSVNTKTITISGASKNKYSEAAGSYTINLRTGDQSAEYSVTTYPGGGPGNVTTTVGLEKKGDNRNNNRPQSSTAAAQAPIYMPSGQLWEPVTANDVTNLAIAVVVTSAFLIAPESILFIVPPTIRLAFG